MHSLEKETMSKRIPNKTLKYYRTRHNSFLGKGEFWGEFGGTLEENGGNVGENWGGGEMGEE